MGKRADNSGYLLNIMTSCLVTSADSPPHDKGKLIHIAFRLDDYSAISDTDLELRILDLFQEKKIGITFAVVPFVCAGKQKDPSRQQLAPLSREKGGILKTKIASGFLDVALHGYSHQTSYHNEVSEFSGLKYQEQLNRLVKGRNFLKKITGISVDGFVPPWNSYDQNTLLALDELGFRIISAGWKGAVTKESGLHFIPATCDLGHLRDAVVAARNSADRQPVIVVLFHHYDFKEFDVKRGGMTLGEFSELLDWLASQDDLKLMSVGQLSRSGSDFSAERFSALERWRSLEKFLPFKFQEKKPVLLYHEPEVLDRTRLKIAFYFIGITLFFFLCLFVLFFLIFPSSRLIAKVVLFISGFMALSINLYAYRDFQVSPKGLIASLITIGSFGGMLCAFLIHNYL